MGEAPDEQPSMRWSGARQVALGLLVAVAVAAVLSYSLSAPKGSARRQVATVSVRNGPACPALKHAEIAWQRGDIEALRRSIHTAIHVAVASLKRDDLAFGRPERLAMKLDAVRLKAPLPSRERDHIGIELKRALLDCEAINS